MGGAWSPGLVLLSFLSYFYASYFDIGVPCKLLSPVLGDHTSLLVVFLYNISWILYFDIKSKKYYIEIQPNNKMTK